MKLYKSKPLIFPKKSGKKGAEFCDTPKSDLQNVAQNTLKELHPRPRAFRVEARGITAQEKEGSAHKALQRVKKQKHLTGYAKKRFGYNRRFVSVVKGGPKRVPNSNNK